MEFTIQLADLSIRINCIYEYTMIQCKDYLIPDCKTDIEVSTCESDLISEFEKTSHADEFSGKTIDMIPPFYLESSAVYRKITEQVIKYNTFLMHGSAISYKNQSVILSASSGTGKTTVTQKLLEKYPGSFVINGDKPLVHFSEQTKQFVVYGTPWSGKENLNKNTSSFLQKIIILKRGEREEVKRISPAMAFPEIYQQTYQSLDLAHKKATLHLLSKLLKQVEVWQYIMKDYKDVRELKPPLLL